MYIIVNSELINIFIGFFEFFLKYIITLYEKYDIMEILEICWNVLSDLRLFCKIIYVFK